MPSPRDAKCLRSPPTQKFLPFPRMRSARTAGSPATVAVASRRSRPMSRLMPFPASGRLKARTATPSRTASSIVTQATLVSRDLRRALAVRRDRRLQLLDGLAQRVDLGIEGGQLRRRRRAGCSLELLVAGLEQAAGVVLLGDVAAEELAGADVDRVVAEDVVEVGEDAFVDI